MTEFELNMLISALSGLSVKFEKDCPMSQHTGFRAGGYARLALFPQTVDALVDTLGICDKYKKCVPTVILGGGSNTLFCDGEFDGIVIITTQLKEYVFSDDGAQVTVLADCGVPISVLSKKASDYTIREGIALSGLEFAYGIPGTVGGAVAMNAGAYGGEMKDVVISSVCYDRSSGEIVTLDAAEHNFAYRKSAFSENKNLVVLQTKLCLTYSDQAQIKAKMQENLKSRKDKQPLEYPSCGSTFLRPEGRFVGKMTEDSGLKGYSVGGAQLSEKHGGFVINRGNATANDILAVIEHIKEVILKNYDVRLECEIKIISSKEADT